MKKYLLLVLLIPFVICPVENSAKAQTIELLAGNTLNGAMNGVLLGGATMALQNTQDFEPVRIGLGAGTLYGIGVGVYDITQVSKGQQFYKSGTFNDATNSSIIVLLDTIYGAAGGALIASSVSLIIAEPLDKALQYGSGTGAWIGFGFGLIDSFMLADGPNIGQAQSISSGTSDVSGLLTYSNKSKTVEIGVVNPEVVTHKTITNSQVNNNYTTSLNVVQFHIDL